MSCKKHRCACEHEDVKYCKKCCVVHCMSCNQEWTAKGWYQPYYYGNGWTLGGNSFQPTTAADPNPTITYTSGSTCDH